MFPSLPIAITPVGFLVTHKKHPQSFGQQCRQILRLIRLLIFTFTFMLSVTRMLSVKRGGVIILTRKSVSCPPFYSLCLFPTLTPKRIRIRLLYNVLSTSIDHVCSAANQECCCDSITNGQRPISSRNYCRNG